MLKTTSLIAVIGGLEIFDRRPAGLRAELPDHPAAHRGLRLVSRPHLACSTIGQHYLEAYYGKGFGEKETEAAEKRADRASAEDAQRQDASQ